MCTTGKQCGLAATGDYQISLRSPWLAAVVHLHATVFAVTLLNVLSRDSDDLPGEKLLEAYEIYCEQVRPQGDVNPAELAKAGPSNNGNWQLLDINCA
ncbi:hypothetical protein, partial [Thiolapillus sp.]|uniref:hypothetical protein n=1 Tax=Thiolapillus sp. TaxID=2017437 RepID=UPI003AF6A6C2